MTNQRISLPTLAVVWVSSVHEPNYLQWLRWVTSQQGAIITNAHTIFPLIWIWLNSCIQDRRCRLRKRRWCWKGIVWWISTNCRRRLAILPGPCWCLWLSNTQFVQLGSQCVQILLHHIRNHYNTNHTLTKYFYIQLRTIQWNEWALFIIVVNLT